MMSRKLSAVLSLRTSLLALMTGLLMAGQAVLAASVIEGKVIDPLERPSGLSTKAQGSLLTSIALAGKRLVAVGDRGIALVSDDQGKTWSQRSTPVSVMLTGVRFADAQRGWIVGHAGVVLSTSDGGNTWKRVLDGRRIASLYLDTTKAKAASAGASSEEAARHAKDLAEAERFAQEGADKPLLDVMFDPDIGFLAVGAFGVVLHSKNGQDGWEVWQHRVPNTKGSHLYSIVKNAGSLYLVGEQGSVFRSIDGGQSFKEIPSQYKGSYFGAVAAGKQDLLVFGLRGNAFRLNADTLAWQQLQLPTQANVNYGLQLKSGGIVLLTQNGEALYAADGQNQFKPQALPKIVPLLGAVQTGDDSVALVGLQGPFIAKITASAP